MKFIIRNVMHDLSHASRRLGKSPTFKPTLGGKVLQPNTNRNVDISWFNAEICDRVDSLIENGSVALYKRGGAELPNCNGIRNDLGISLVKPMAMPEALHKEIIVEVVGDIDAVAKIEAIEREAEDKAIAEKEAIAELPEEKPSKMSKTQLRKLSAAQVTELAKFYGVDTENNKSNTIKLILKAQGV